MLVFTVMVEQQIDNHLADFEHITGLHSVRGSINLGGLGFIIFTVDNPREIDLGMLSEIQESTLGNPVIRRYLDEHPEEITEQESVIRKLTQQIPLPRVNS